MAKPVVAVIHGTIIAGGQLSQATILAVNQAATKAWAQWRRFVAYAGGVEAGGSLAGRASNPGSAHDSPLKIDNVAKRSRGVGENGRLQGQGRQPADRRAGACGGGQRGRHCGYRGASVMKRLGLVALLIAAHTLVHAGDQAAVGCQSVKLVLDKRVTPRELARFWASGEQTTGAPAVLQLQGCNGELLDSMTLEAPLAKLDSALLRGVRSPTVLVTVDLTAPVGSYSGPLTKLVQVEGNRLTYAQARAADGHLQPIVLAQTGKAAWKKVRVGAVDQLLAVRSEPRDGKFTTSYRSYVHGKRGWTVRVRSRPGLWESDGEFPSRRSFP